MSNIFTATNKIIQQYDGYGLTNEIEKIIKEKGWESSHIWEEITHIHLAHRDVAELMLILHNRLTEVSNG